MRRLLNFARSLACHESGEDDTRTSKPYSTPPRGAGEAALLALSTAVKAARTAHSAEEIRVAAHGE